MFDLGWTELLLIGVVALIVVGPKDLPGMFRALGKFTAKMRAMAREFQRAMDQAADDSGVNELAAELKTAASAKKLGLDRLQESALKFQKNTPQSILKDSVLGERSNKEAANDAPQPASADKPKASPSQEFEPFVPDSPDAEATGEATTSVQELASPAGEDEPELTKEAGDLRQ